MSFTRKLTIALIVAFLGTAAFKAVRARQQRELNQRDLLQAENTRRFWETYRLASQKRAVGDLDAAATLYEQALALKTDHEDSLYYQGNCHFERGRYREAIAAYQRLIAANPLGSSRGYMQLGLVYSCLDADAPRNLDKAAEYFQRTVQVDPDSGGQLALGEVAMLRGEWSKARNALTGANADNPMSMAAPYLLGYLCFREGKREEAWNWFRLAVQRGELKKPAVKWTEEGDVKADPELRWRALARQSVFGKYWLPLRRYLKSGSSPEDMKSEYDQLRQVLDKLHPLAAKEPT
jgi:tetratricopeptide (TPR) repeat protein